MDWIMNQQKMFFLSKFKPINFVKSNVLFEPNPSKTVLQGSMTSNGRNLFKTYTNQVDMTSRPGSIRNVAPPLIVEDFSDIPSTSRGIGGTTGRFPIRSSSGLSGHFNGDRFSFGSTQIREDPIREYTLSSGIRQPIESDRAFEATNTLTEAMESNSIKTLGEAGQIATASEAVESEDPLTMPTQLAAIGFNSVVKGLAENQPQVNGYWENRRRDNDIRDTTEKADLSTGLSQLGGAVGGPAGIILGAISGYLAPDTQNETVHSTSGDISINDIRLT